MDEVSIWLEEIKTAKKREKDFRKSGKDILEIYEEGEKTPFNILYSNTETLLPALFSDLPKPVVQRRFHDDDPFGKAVGEAAQRMLEYLLDTDIEEYDRFQGAVEDAVLDGLLPGRGVTSVKYEAEIDESDEFSSVNYETVCTDSRCWDRVYFGYAKKWCKVPWIAYEEYLDKKECLDLFEESIVNKLTFTYGEDDDEETDDNEDKGKRKTVCVYQIWDKSDRKIKYITPQYKDGYLKVDDDPLGLVGFYNCPEPLRFVRKSKNLTPTSPYKLYENQAKELNRIQLRLNSVIEAIKVRGAYDSALGDDLERIFEEEDNGLTPTEKGATLANQGGLDKSIWLIPIEKLIVVAQQLYQARESCKQVIYEITGISDIVRGQSMASETLGAQKIKEAWGTMRLKRLQKQVQRYALDLMKIQLEIAANKFSERTWKKVTNLPFPLEEEKQRAQAQLQLMRQQVGPDGQPDPKLVQMTQMPSFAEIIEALKNDNFRSYRLDIETNSTLDVEATEDKQLIAEFMNAFAQLTNGMAPLVENGSLPFEAFKSMMLAIVRRYRFGREVEDQLNSMQPPQPGGQQAKQLAEQGKKIAQEKKKFDDEKQKAERSLDEKFNKLEVERAVFEFKKKLADLELKHKAELEKVKQEAANEEVKAMLKSMLMEHKRDVQSMFDKQTARMEKKRAAV